MLGVSNYTQHVVGPVDAPTGIAFTREFKGLYELTQSVSGQVAACLQGKQYLSASHSSDGEPVASIEFVLRTSKRYVDRRNFYIAYQPRDEFGSTAVQAGFSLCG